MASRFAVGASLAVLLLMGIAEVRAAAQNGPKHHEPVRHMDSFAIPGRWRTATPELTITSAKKPLARGRPTLHLRVVADHRNPPDKNPIGWPAMYLNLEAGEKQWEKFERFEFLVSARSAQWKPEGVYAVFQIMCPDKETGADLVIRIPKPDTWMLVSVPVTSIANLSSLGSLLFYTAEKQYEHGQTVEFFLGDFRLVGTPGQGPASVPGAAPEVVPLLPEKDARPKPEAKAEPISLGRAIALDFGTDQSPVRDGFIRITQKSTFGEESRAGWLKTEGLSAIDRGVPRKVGGFPPFYINDLRRDSVQGRHTAILRIKAPPGKFRAWIMAGTGGGNEAQVWDIHISSGRSSTRATFYGPDTVRLMRMGAVSSQRGYLDFTITTRSKWALNAMVIVPEQEWPALERTAIAKWERESTMLPDDVLAKWTFLPHLDDTPPPDYTEAEKERGFVIYHRPWMAPIWPNTVPRREEFDPTLKAFACPGEYEPLTFTILPLRDLGNLTVQVADLRSDNGDFIPGHDIQVRYVRYEYVRVRYNRHDKYRLVPNALPPLREPRPLKAKENLRLWLTVHVPPYAPQGVYRGVVTLNIAGQHAAEVPVEFRVLPIVLHKAPSILYATYYRHPSRWISRAPDDFSRRWWTRKLYNDLQSMAEHGVESYVTYISAFRNRDGKWVAIFDEFDRQIDMARRFGFAVGRPWVGNFQYSLDKLYRKYMDQGIPGHLFGVKIPPQAFFDDVTEMVRAFEAERRRRRLPEIIYYPFDEPNPRTKESIRFMTLLMQAVKKVPGVRTYVTAYPTLEPYAPMKPYVDVWCTQSFVAPIEQVQADYKERGVEY